MYETYSSSHKPCLVHSVHSMCNGVGSQVQQDVVSPVQVGNYIPFSLDVVAAPGFSTYFIYHVA